MTQLLAHWPHIPVHTGLPTSMVTGPLAAHSSAYRPPGLSDLCGHWPNGRTFQCIQAPPAYPTSVVTGPMAAHSNAYRPPGLSDICGHWPNGRIFQCIQAYRPLWSLAQWPHIPVHTGPRPIRPLWSHLKRYRDKIRQDPT